MTLDTKKGMENVTHALRQYLSGNLPAAIDTMNNATSATLEAYLKGPYVFDGSKKISVKINKAGSAIEVTPSNASLTAAQLAAELNADGTFNASLTADTIQQGNYLRIYQTSRGSAGSLEAQDESGNVLLGWPSGYTDNYQPLRDIAEIEVQYQGMQVLAYPALHIFGLGYNDTAPGELREYQVRLRIYDTVPDATWAGVLYRHLERYAKIVNDLLFPMTSGSRSLYGQVNDIQLSTATFGNSIEVPLDTTAGLYRAWVEFNADILVQEG